MNRSQLDRVVVGILEKAGLEEPALEARHLLMALFGVDGAGLITTQGNQVIEEQRHKALNWAVERARGVPLAYLTGVKGFYKNEFHVRSGVLIPRPETEHIIEVALKRAKPPARFADLGCGTGCIGLSLLLEWPQAMLDAVDSTLMACELSRINAAKLGLTSRVRLVHSLVEEWNPHAHFDVIVANPPYIAENDTRVEKSVRDFEPEGALYSGPEGLDAIRTWSAWAFRNLRKDGLFVFEIGAGQAPQVVQIVSDLNFYDVQVTKDLAGIERVISALKKE